MFGSLLSTFNQLMNQYQQLIDRGYEFKMGQYMSEGWDLFKKGAGSYIGFTVVFAIIYVILMVIPFINLLGGFIITVLVAGIYIYSNNLIRGREDFGNFFEGFKDFGQIFLFQLVLFLIFIPLLILLFSVAFPVGVLPEIISGDYDPQWLSEEIAASFEQNFGLVALIYFLFLFAMLYLYTSYSLVLPLIVISKLGFWDAMETSRKVVAKNFFGFLGLILILGIILSIGSVVTCGLGLLILLPYINCVIFAAYEDIIQPQEDTLKTQVDTFGTQERDINTEAEDKNL